ncbi:MAG: hypothetical protein ACLFOY_00895 [Desulfatibacillaceae bacterium]
MSQKPEPILVDREMVHNLASQGCAICGHGFAMGETVVPAEGEWEGTRYVHEQEAVWEPEKCAFVARGR